MGRKTESLIDENKPPPTIPRRPSPARRSSPRGRGKAPEPRGARKAGSARPSAASGAAHSYSGALGPSREAREVEPLALRGEDGEILPIGNPLGPWGESGHLDGGVSDLAAALSRGAALTVRTLPRNR